MDYKLIQNQILWTDIIRILWQKVRRITDKILGAKGLMQLYSTQIIKKYSISCLFKRKQRPAMQAQE